jgi:hypothetical protein
LPAVVIQPSADKLAYRVHYETQTAYIKARDGGQRVAFCKDFMAANSQYAKARFTAVVEGHISDVSTGFCADIVIQGFVAKLGGSDAGQVRGSGRPVFIYFARGAGAEGPSAAQDPGAGA